MTSSNRGFRGRNNIRHERVLDEQSEGVGNRKTFDEIRVPPDNIGNKLDESLAECAHDGTGNDQDEATHLKSGILACLAQAAAKANVRRRVTEDSHLRGKHRFTHPTIAPPPSVVPTPEEYFTRLKADFAKLLSAKTGLAFSFSMKPFMSQDQSAFEAADEELGEIHDLINELFEANTISATVTLENYHTTAHRFAVFFIRPEETDSAKNKELIAALRQVISTHANMHVRSHVNIFLVLANAQAVIEEHLFKIGAKKLELE
jgi:hypothetical protein